MPVDIAAHKVLRIIRSPGFLDIPSLPGFLKPTLNNKGREFVVLWVGYVVVVVLPRGYHSLYVRIACRRRFSQLLTHEGIYKRAPLFDPEDERMCCACFAARYRFEEVPLLCLKNGITAAAPIRQFESLPVQFWWPSTVGLALAGIGRSVSYALLHGASRCSKEKGKEKVNLSSGLISCSLDVSLDLVEAIRQGIGQDSELIAKGKEQQKPPTRIQVELRRLTENSQIRSITARTTAWASIEHLLGSSVGHRKRR
jgi:hypothetical protein